MFDKNKALSFLDGDDRDIAPYFAGRTKEIDRFRAALRGAKLKSQARFLIFQGAPGCGKTSLAKHLSDTHGEVLFVPCEPGDLLDSATLSDRIERMAIKRGGRVAEAARLTAASAGEHLGARPLADAAIRAVAGLSSKDATVVIHLDEAHGRVNGACPGVDQTLLTLHTVGVDVPCVVLLTGLGHTYETVTSIKGLSRLSRNSVCEVGELSKRDCVRSTQMMLDSLKPEGPAYIRDRLADMTGELAHQWPAHLNGAQVALCEELVRVRGVLLDVNAEAVRARSDGLRREYYDRRLSQHLVLRIDRPLTRRILVDVGRERPISRIKLGRVCRRAIDRTGEAGELEAYGLTPKAMADALLDKGILRDTGREIVASIPSMVDWAAVEVGVEPPPSNTG